MLKQEAPDSLDIRHALDAPSPRTEGHGAVNTGIDLDDAHAVDEWLGKTREENQHESNESWEEEVRRLVAVPPGIRRSDGGRAGRIDAGHDDGSDMTAHGG